jgi:glycosyltransferase involved in cell wall biosynthesis
MQKVSIIITARNYSQYLEECINSCKNQTIPAFEIIYSDDCSDDDSVAIAKSLGIKVIENKKWLGVVKARNKGADLSKGNILLFLDGDDYFPEDFIEKQLEVFDETTPFVYCAAQAFGAHNTFWKVYPWKERSLWHRNFVNTCALMWKDIFIKAGKWQETCENTMWDWSLSIRMSRFGIPRKSSAHLMYRQHPNSWSITKEKKGAKDLIRLSENIRKELVIMSIGLIYSGRIPNFIIPWINQLVDDIKILKNLPELIIINNSNENLKNILISYKPYFSKIKIISENKKLVWNSEVDRRNKVCELLSEQYNMILENMSGDLIHLREDDIIPNEGSFTNLYNFITSGNPLNAAAAGIYLNRNINYKKLIGGYFNNENPKNTQDLDFLPSTEPFKVDYTGTGFLLFWKDLCPDKFNPYYKGIQAHDWAWSFALKNSGKDLWMIPNAICKHYNDIDNYILPPKDISKDNIIPAYTYTKINNQEKIEKAVIIKPKWQ